MDFNKIIEYLNKINLPEAPFELYLLALLFMTTGMVLSQFFVGENVYETRFKENTEISNNILKKLTEYEITGEIDYILYYHRILELTQNQPDAIFRDSYIFSIKFIKPGIYSPTYRRFLPDNSPTFQGILYKKDFDLSCAKTDYSQFGDFIVYYGPYLQHALGISLGWLCFQYCKKYF